MSEIIKAAALLQTYRTALVKSLRTRAVGWLTSGVTDVATAQALANEDLALAEVISADVVLDTDEFWNRPKPKPPTDEERR